MLNNNSYKQDKQDKKEYRTTEQKINDALEHCFQKYTLKNDKGIIPNDHRVIELSGYLNKIVN